MCAALGCERAPVASSSGSNATHVSATSPAAESAQPVIHGMTVPRAGPLPALASPYPRGAWRKASAAELERVVLWPSHLLIRYTGARDEANVSFSMAEFHS